MFAPTKSNNDSRNRLREVRETNALMQHMLTTMAAFVEKDFRVGNVVTNGGVGDPHEKANSGHFFTLVFSAVTLRFNHSTIFV